MKKSLFQEINIPENVEVFIEGDLVKVKGKEGESQRKFKIGSLKIEKEGNKIKIGNKNSTKREKKNMNTIVSHINNMIKGVQKKFEYILKVCFSHFPITVEIKEDEVTIKNFLGEKVPRKTKLPKNVEVKINKDIITINSCNKELAGQAAANFEMITKVRGKDRRVFQDGIFIINKAGKEI